MGAAAFPYMVDPNSKTSMGESDDIINYLYETYGEGAKVKQWFSPSPLDNWRLCFYQAMFLDGGFTVFLHT